MRKRFLIFAVFGGVFFAAFVPARPGSEPVTVSVAEGRLRGVLGNVAEQAHAELWISPGVEDLPVSISATGVPVREVLSGLCARERCRWKRVTSIVVWDAQEPTPEWSVSSGGEKPCQP